VIWVGKILAEQGMMGQGKIMNGSNFKAYVAW